MDNNRFTFGRNLLKISYIFINLLSISVTVIIRPQTSLEVQDDEGFIVYLENTKSFGPIKSCWFQFQNDEKIKIDLNTSEPINTKRNEFIYPFSTTVCGIRVNKVSTASDGFWLLEAENFNNILENDKVQIDILPKIKANSSINYLLDYGKDLFQCTKNDEKTKHCKIFDVVHEKRRELAHQCQLYTEIRPNTNFECHTFNDGRIEKSIENIKVDIKRLDLFTNASVEENPNGIVMRCQFQDSLYSCLAIMPDQINEIYISDGLFNGRYSTFDTNTIERKCAFEILKPLKSNEIGLWRIINYDSKSSSGCLFYVGKNKQEIIEEELENIQTIRTLNAYSPHADNKVDDNSTKIDCILPFVIEDCYLRDPDNKIYYPNDYDFHRTKLHGKCAFTELPIIPGIWTCGARGRDYEKEIVQDIQLIVKSKFGEVLTESTSISSGSSVELMCRAPFEEPISHCAFIDPNNRVHLVGTINSIKASGHVKYFGRGIDRGECGIKINKVNSNDFGKWRCQFNIVGLRNVSAFDMELNKSHIGYATSVGLGVGLFVVLVLLLGVITGTIIYRRRHLTARHSFTSNEQIEMTDAATSSI